MVYTDPNVTHESSLVIFAEDLKDGVTQDIDIYAGLLHNQMVESLNKKGIEEKDIIGFMSNGYLGKGKNLESELKTAIKEFQDDHKS